MQQRTRHIVVGLALLAAVVSATLWARSGMWISEFVEYDSGERTSYFTTNHGMLAVGWYRSFHGATPQWRYAAYYKNPPPLHDNYRQHLYGLVIADARLHSFGVIGVHGLLPPAVILFFLALWRLIRRRLARLSAMNRSVAPRTWDDRATDWSIAVYFRLLDAMLYHQMFRRLLARVALASAIIAATAAGLMLYDWSGGRPWLTVVAFGRGEVDLIRYRGRIIAAFESKGAALGMWGVVPSSDDLDECLDRLSIRSNNELLWDFNANGCNVTVDIKDSFILMIGLALPAVWLFARPRDPHSRRVRAGLCGQCGYDLRASKGRCPECGEPIPHAAAASSICAESVQS